MSIIVEGPDGAGKTTLVQELQNHFPQMELHPRFCTSTGGPIANLTEEVYRDTKSAPTHFLYDRHPTVSEYVYNTSIPDRRIRSEFLTFSMMKLRNRVASHSLMIFCIPPINVVIDNVRRDQSDQMPGVVDNIVRIYEQYMMHMLMWPGRTVHYDYTQSMMSWEGLRYVLAETKGKLWKDAP